jgi:hypothetical protein
VFLKVYNIDSDTMVAVCDEDILGKEFSEGDLRLKVNKEFYGNVPADYDEVVSALGEATIANIVGKESVACAVENGFVDVDAIIYIDGIPHVQIICV